MKPLLVSLRPGQWLKNALLFAAIIFNGKLFYFPLFKNCLWGFVVFSLVSSASYLINDISEIKNSWFKDVEKLGITAGASAPKYLIDEVVKYFSKPKVKIEELI